MKKIFAIAASALVLAAPAISAQERSHGEAIVAYTAVNWSTVGAIPLATKRCARRRHELEPAVRPSELGR